jgi:hypothetical protein
MQQNACAELTQSRHRPSFAINGPVRPSALAVLALMRRCPPYPRKASADGERFGIVRNDWSLSRAHREGAPQECTANGAVPGGQAERASRRPQRQTERSEGDCSGSCDWLRRRTCTGWIAPACGWRTYSMISSARPSSVIGKVMPSAFADLRLMIISTLLDCWIGRSPGFSPLRMRPA